MFIHFHGVSFDYTPPSPSQMAMFRQLVSDLTFHVLNKPDATWKRLEEIKSICSVTNYKAHTNCPEYFGVENNGSVASTVH
jgi:hypothetical protein